MRDLSLEPFVESNREQLALIQDDIDDPTWEKIDGGITQHGFKKLLQRVQDDIDLWVFANLDDAQSQHIEERKWELRKWNMTWRILFPSCTIPPSPCKFPRTPSFNSIN
jgi:hypothetical protein